MGLLGCDEHGRVNVTGCTGCNARSREYRRDANAFLDAEAARHEARVELAEAVRLLRAVEHVDTAPPRSPECLFCGTFGSDVSRAHKSRCELAAFLARHPEET